MPYYWPNEWLVNGQTTTGSYIWPRWVQTTTSNTTINAWGAQANQAIWPRWVATGNLKPYTQPTPRNERPLTHQPDPGAERRLAIAHRRGRVRRLRERVAQRKAEQLLLENLDAKQREDWMATKSFTIETADGKRAYLLKLGLAGNVYLVRDDENAEQYRRVRAGMPLARYCCHVYHPDGRVPNEDNVLTQKLLLETDEQRFLDLANLA